MQYTDKQIEEAVEKTVVQNPSGTLVDLTKLIMRMVGEQLDDRIAHHLEGWHNAKRYKSLDPLPEFWKEPEETPEEIRFGGVDVSNGPPTGEQAKRLRTLHEARELIDALIQESAGIREPAPPGWQPIETAPKDGSSILVAEPELCDKGLVAVWDKRRGWVCEWDYDSLANEPTHWMPIPPLPEDK